MTIQKSGIKITFDVVVQTRRGKLYCANLQRDGEISSLSIKVSKDKAYKMLGHSGHESIVQWSRLWVGNLLVSLAGVASAE